MFEHVQYIYVCHTCIYKCVWDEQATKAGKTFPDNIVNCIVSYYILLLYHIIRYSRRDNTAVGKSSGTDTRAADDGDAYMNEKKPSYLR